MNDSTIPPIPNRPSNEDLVFLRLSQTPSNSSWLEQYSQRAGLTMYSQALALTPVSLSGEEGKRRWELLNTINRDVNARIKYLSDQANYGVEEFAANPLSTSYTGKYDGDMPQGDCEDFAFAKLEALIAAGWPAESLSVALVSTEGGGHAVLVVRTDCGDLVLDNDQSTSTIRHWASTPYQFQRLQAGGNSIYDAAIDEQAGRITNTIVWDAGKAQLNTTYLPVTKIIEQNYTGLGGSTFPYNSPSLSYTAPIAGERVSIDLTDNLISPYDSYVVSSGNNEFGIYQNTYSGGVGVRYLSDNAGYSTPLPLPAETNETYYVFTETSLGTRQIEALRSMRQTAENMGIRWAADWGDGTIEVPRLEKMRELAEGIVPK